MILVYGTHHFGLKKTGVRKDFCSACRRECVAELYESFDFGHFFYIPILPFGRKRRWICTLCHQDPRGRQGTSTTFRILALILFPFIGFPLLFFGIRSLLDHVDEAWAVIALSAIFLVPWLFMLYRTIKPRKGPTDEERRGGITPLNREECFYCHGPTTGEPNSHCPSCDMTIYTE